MRFNDIQDEIKIKEQALEATVRKYTNLIDGSVKPYISVRTIINHYQNLIDGINIPTSNYVGNIENRFIDEAFKYIEGKEDF